MHRALARSILYSGVTQTSLLFHSFGIIFSLNNIFWNTLFFIEAFQYFQEIISRNKKPTSGRTIKLVQELAGEKENSSHLSLANIEG